MFGNLLVICNHGKLRRSLHLSSQYRQRALTVESYVSSDTLDVARPCTGCGKFSECVRYLRSCAHECSILNSLMKHDVSHLHSLPLGSSSSAEPDGIIIWASTKRIGHAQRWDLQHALLALQGGRRLASEVAIRTGHREGAHREVCDSGLYGVPLL